MTLDGTAIGRRVASARQRRGRTQAELAASAELERSALAKIETGARRVSALELARLSAALDERIEWFLEDPVDVVISHRNSAEPGEAESMIDAALDHLVRDVEFLLALGTLQVVGSTPTLRRPRGVAQVERDAVRVRELLGIDGDGPLTNCERAAENIGLLAFSLALPAGAADAATVLLESAGVSLVNGDLHVGRRRLALAHEIGHYIYADEYSVDWRIGHDDTAGSWEALVDRFARALLLPATGLRDMWMTLAGRGESLRTSAVRTASAFRVDMATLARRLEELEIVDTESARAVRASRTIKADIVEYDLVVHDELVAPSLPRSYQVSVLHAVRAEKMSAIRAVELLHGSFDFESLPTPAELPHDAVWQFV